MAQISGGIVAAIVVVLALTGCSAGEPVAQAEAPVASSSPTVTPRTTPTPEPTTARIKAAPIEVTASPRPEDTPQALQSKWYGVIGKTFQNGGYEFPLIGDVLPVGQYICDQMRAGVAPDDIVAVKATGGEQEYVNQTVVGYTLMDGYVLTAEQEAVGETLPDYCADLFPAS